MIDYQSIWGGKGGGERQPVYEGKGGRREGEVTDKEENV